MNVYLPARTAIAQTMFSSKKYSSGWTISALCPPRQIPGPEGGGISNRRNLLSRHAGRGHSSLLCFRISLYNKPKVPELRSVRRGGSGARAAWSAAPRRPTRAGTLTLVADEEAHAGPAAVRGEEQRQERAGADQEVRRLRAVELADERRRRGRPVAHLQRVVVHLGLKPAHR